MRPALVLAACAAGPVPPPSAKVDPPPPRPAPTAWQARCMTALEQLERDAGQIEPEIRTAEISYDGDHRVSVSAFPPVWKVNLSIQLSREAGTPADWQFFNEPFHGSNHLTWMHRTATTEVAILLDGWEIDRAERIKAALLAGVEPCLL